MNKKSKSALLAFIPIMFIALIISSCEDKIKSCETGYEGSDCRTLSRAKFIGQWKGSEECNDNDEDYTISITTNSTNDLTINYTNVNNKNFVATGKIVSGNELHIEGNAIGTGGGKINFSGSALLDESSGTITVNYLISSDITNTGCTFIGKKI